MKTDMLVNKLRPIVTATFIREDFGAATIHTKMRLVQAYPR